MSETATPPTDTAANQPAASSAKAKEQGTVQDALNQLSELKVYTHSPILYWWPIWALGLIFGFAVLSIDVAAVLLTKTQLQNAADAAAVAGALELGLSGGDQGAARTVAIDLANDTMALVGAGGLMVTTSRRVTRRS